MANYSRRNTSKRSSKPGTSAPFLWMFLGVMLGVSAVVVSYSFYTGTFSLDKIRRFVHDQTASPSERSQSKLARASSHSSQTQTQSHLHSGPHQNSKGNTLNHAQTPSNVHAARHSKNQEQQAVNKQETSPRFEFYTLLPGAEVQIPDEPEKKSSEKTSKKTERQAKTESRHKFDHKARQLQSQSRKLDRNKRDARKKTEPRKARVVSLNRPSPTLRSDFNKNSTLSLKKAQPEKSQAQKQNKDVVLMHGTNQSPVTQVASLKASNVVPATSSAPATNTPSASPVAAASIQAPSSNSKTEPEVNYVKTPGNKPTTISGAQYIIQAGVFQELQPADMLKAKLTLQGFNTRVQKVQAQNGQTYFRVTLGPYTSETLAIREKKRLKKENKIPGILILQRRLD